MIDSNQMRDHSNWTAIEVAWWDGKAWRRKVVRTEKALERLVEKLNEAGVSDIRTREADV
jgi:hypothetical protein